MSKHDRMDQIQALLKQISLSTSQISRQTERESDLDIDLVMEDIRNLYRAYTMLKREQQEVYGSVADDNLKPEQDHHAITRPVPPPVEQPAFEQAAPTARSVHQPSDHGQPVVPVQPPVEVPPTSSATVSEPPSEPALTEFPELKPKPVATPPAQAYEPPKTGNGKQIIDVITENQAKAIGDQLAGDDNSLHQRISSQKEDTSISARLQQYPISNIRDAIGLNEKFLFINELFNGDILAYNNAITKLNGLDSVNQAFDYLNGLARDFSWDRARSSETIEKLANFVQRRYLQE